MKGKVIFVLSSDDRHLVEGGKRTGWYLPEAAHPYKALTEAGYEITFVSPKGGKAPMDEGSYDQYKDEEDCKVFLEKNKSKLENTLKPSEVKASEYVGLFYAGGHGPMFDLPGCDDIANLAQEIYEKNEGVLGAICHGTVGFEPVKLSNGEALVKGQTVTSFTNAEEDAVNLTDKMPFLLETRLRELGANFVAAANWACNVQVSGRLVSGQNPQSASECGKQMVALLDGVAKK